MDKNTTDKTTLERLSEIIDGILCGNPGSQTTTDGIPVSENREVNDLVAKVTSLNRQYRESYDYITDLSCGRLDGELPRHNTFAAPYKKLQSELRHLTWQICRIAEGDYSQRVSFSGDFSDSFNRMILDLRERKVLLRQLGESNASKDKLFAIIAHDLKAPMAGLLGFSEALIGELAEGNMDTAKEFSRIIRSSTAHAYDLLVNLLEWSRQQRGKIVVCPEVFDLGTAIQYSLATARITAIAKGVSITFSGSGKTPVRTDHALLSAIMRNLVGNAVKYTHNGGHVAVKVARIPGFYSISVQDDGIGIGPENLSRLFDVGAMHSTPGTDSEPGTGLGLILCKEFVCMLGGEISVESSVEQGSVFTFTIPDDM